MRNIVFYNIWHHTTTTDIRITNNIQDIQETIAAQFKDKTEEVSRLEKDIKYYLEKNQRDAATMSEKEKTELEGKIIALREEYTASLAHHLQTAGCGLGYPWLPHQKTLFPPRRRHHQ